MQNVRKEKRTGDSRILISRTSSTVSLYHLYSFFLFLCYIKLYCMTDKYENIIYLFNSQRKYLPLSLCIVFVSFMSSKKTRFILFFTRNTCARKVRKQNNDSTFILPACIYRCTCSKKKPKSNEKIKKQNI